MSTIDKEKVLYDRDIDSLMDDWLVRDGETFTKIRTKDRLGWEEVLEKDAAYSSYFLEAPTQEDLIRRAYSLAKDMIVVMDTPFKVVIRISNSGVSCTDGRVVLVSTNVFDERDLSVGEKLDVFVGTAIHEGCHLLYTDFKVCKRICTKAVGTILNIIEDERIETILGEEKPGLARFLEKVKYYYFDQLYLDYILPKEKEGEINDFERLLSIFLYIIRYPKYLKESDIVFFGHHLLAIKEVMLPYPDSTDKALVCAEKVFEIMKDFYVEKEMEEESKKDSPSESGEGGGGAGGGGGSESGESGVGKKEISEEKREELEKRASEKMDKDMREIIEKLSAVSDSPDKEKLSADSMADSVKKDSGLLGDLCAGLIEVGKDNNSFFTKAPTNREMYLDSYSRISRYVPAISKILRGHCKEYKLIHRSMRSGILDTTKLAEAIQGVQTIFLREGQVTTDKVTVCVLIDESGSMSGHRISAARDTAILLNEAVGKLPGVELYIYGHSGDIRHSGTTELMVYKEKTFAPKYALGSSKARCENRDGVAILETALRVRKQTKNRSLMFVLSDGSPCASAYHGAEAISHVKRTVSKVESMGFDVIQVCINHSYDPASMFKHFVILEDMNKLAFELGKVIKKATLKAAKVHVA